MPNLLVEKNYTLKLKFSFSNNSPDFQEMHRKTCLIYYLLNKYHTDYSRKNNWMKIPTFWSIYEKNIGFVENDILLYFD